MYSLFYDDIVAVMKILRNHGFQLLYLETFFQEFETYCLVHYPDKSILTYEIAEDWIYNYETTSKQQLDKRVRTMKHLGRYQRGVGKDAYIPRYKIEAPRPEPPYLFTDEQLSEFFEKLDQLKPDSRGPNRQFIFPVMFRLIYCCGLRSSEACKLRVSDVDFETGTLSIYHSKGFKDRLIYMNNDVNELCLRFHQYYTPLMPNREYFFSFSNEKWALYQY
jgi:integrase